MKLSTKFVEEHLGDLEEMANGSAEALERVKKAAVISFVGEFDFADDSLETALKEEMTRLMELADQNPIGAELTIKNGKALDALNTAL
jgi:hypothetical protein